MKFECKEISIHDEELGCGICLSENADQGEMEKEQTIEEILNSIGRYVMIQRSYPEDEFDKDYLYFESSDFEKSGELKEFEIVLSREKFLLTVNNNLYEVGININNQKFNELKVVLNKIAYKKGKIILKD